MTKTPLHGHRLRTCCTTPLHQRTSSQQFYNLLYNKFTTKGQRICYIAMPEPNISTYQDVGMWQIFVRWWWVCCTTSCRIVVSSSVGGVGGYDRLQRLALFGQCYRGISLGNSWTNAAKMHKIIGNRGVSLLDLELITTYFWIVAKVSRNAPKRHSVAPQIIKIAFSGPQRSRNPWRTDRCRLDRWVGVSCVQNLNLF